MMVWAKNKGMKERRKADVSVYSNIWDKRGIGGRKVESRQAMKQALVTVVGRDHIANVAATDTCCSRIVLMCRSAPLIDGEV